MRKTCSCTVPRQGVNPRTKDNCIACGRRIDPAWTSNDKTTSAFYDRLALALPVRGDDWDVFRTQCEAREFAGRRHFGHRHLERNNLMDAKEEAADGANYFFFDHLQEIRRSGYDHDLALVLTGAYHFFKAHETARLLRARRQGAP